jgi:hypothetical protein
VGRTRKPHDARFDSIEDLLASLEREAEVDG